MSDDVWRPFGTEGDEEEYDALVEHVPDYLRPSLLRWVASHVNTRGGLSPDTIGRLERLTRMNLRPGGRLDWAAFGPLLSDDSTLLRIIDAMLSTMTSGDLARSYRSTLEGYLKEAGSAWTVGKRAGRPALTRRVDATVQAAANAAMSTAGSAATLLRTAWGEAFGREPNASEAYRQAVKAIEAAAVPIVLPTDAIATLGKVIAALAQHPERFEVTLPIHDKNDPYRTLIDMLGLAWHGQYDRHAKGKPGEALSVEQHEAEAVVFLAVTLVQWLTDGVLRRVGPEA